MNGFEEKPLRKMTRLKISPIRSFVNLYGIISEIIIFNNTNNGPTEIATEEALKKDSWVDIDGLYTIGVQVNLFESRGDGTDVLKQIVTPGSNYATDNPTQLTEIYRKISSEIGAKTKNSS